MLKIAVFFLLGAYVSAATLSVGDSRNGASLSLGTNGGSASGAFNFGFDGIKDGLSSIIKTGHDLVGNAVVSATNTAHDVVNSVDKMHNDLTDKIENIGATIGGILDASKQIPNAVFDNLKKVKADLHTRLNQAVEGMTTHFAECSANLKNLLSGSAQEIQQHLNATLNNVLNGANQLTHEVEVHMKGGCEKLGQIEKQLQGLAQKGCEKSKDIINSFKKEGEELSQTLMTGLTDAKNKLQDNLQVIKAKIQEADGEVKEQLEEAAKHIADKISCIDKHMHEMHDQMIEKLKHYQSQGLDFLNGLKANITAKVQNIGANIEAESKLINQFIVNQMLQINGQIHELETRLGELKQKATNESQVAVAKLEECLKTVLTTSLNNLKAESEAMKTKLETATGQTKIFLESAQKKISDEIDRLTKLLNTSVSANVSVGNGGIGANVNVKVGQ